ncbi:MULTISPECIES: PAS domain-containing hybrid sensor histidine kinase/response regulator [Falsihalocynthiibacter]|uniref:PAS domain-containing hybrid sensor histidine kinase/response regulator n=1 Tax=Falsihalocynthiibacter TaxID=2854182 RepID=UPI003001C402
MTSPAKTPTDELMEFEARYTPEGLFLRYGRARVRDFRSRQIVTLGGSIALAWLVSPFFGLAMAVLVVCGEVLDCFCLYRLTKADLAPKDLPRALKLSSVTAFIQGCTLGLCVLSTWYSVADGSTHYFAMIFLTSASINAGLVWEYHKRASKARLSVYASVAIWLSFWDIFGSSGIGNPNLLDTLATGMLAYMTFLYISYANSTFKRRLANSRNIFEQKKKLAEMHATLISKELHSRNLALVAQSANDSVIISGPDRRIEWVNPAFTRITGYDREEVLGRKVADLLNGPETDPKTLKAIADALDQHKSIRVEIQSHTKSGEIVWVDANITPIIAENGTLAKVISVERDITQAKEREKELALAKVAAEEGARTKANFLATMSHEIRTPLNGIIGMADLLKQTKLEGDQGKYTDTILSSGEALLRIINDILDLSKLDAGGIKILMEPFSLSRCLTESVNLLAPLAEEKGIGIKVEFLPDTPDFFVGDVGHIRQIVINLVGNAIKFTPQGEVAICVKTQPVDAGNLIEIAVKDTGIGIAPEALSRIFDEFSQAEEDTTRNYGGTGLGLTISRRFALEMGGDIHVQSTIGVGSCFTLSLTLSAHSGVENLRPLEAAPLSNVLDLRDKRILVAEDNGTNRLLIRKMLERHAGDLQFAQDGIDAVEQYKKHRPELVLMDVSMPKQNGLQATRCIRKFEEEDGSRAIIIALTANAFNSDREECLNSGMDGFLTKPVKMKELLDCVSFHIAQR